MGVMRQPGLNDGKNSLGEEKSSGEKEPLSKSMVKRSKAMVTEYTK